MDPFVDQHLQGVSRTYALLVPLLPPPLDDTVGTAYLLMRIVDTLEDAPQLSTDERVCCFQQLDAALAGDAAAIEALARPIGELEAERALLRAAPEVFARVAAFEPGDREAASSCARAMSAGVRTLLARSAARGLPYPAVCDATELREYCYYVAGVVGDMLCAMMARHLGRPALLQLRPRAMELGIGLQLVNILKDTPRDAAQGRRYLPRAAEGGPSHAAIYQATLGTARQCLQQGIDYVLGLPASARELRSFCGLPIAWGALTLTCAEREPARAKIGRSAIQRSIGQFGTLAGDDEALRGWLTSLLRPSVAVA